MSNTINQLIENLVIIGSGPAGYTAGIYSARANLNPLLITGFQRGGIPGGQLMTTTYVENFPGFPNGIMGPDLMDLIKAQATRWGTRLLEEDVELINLKDKPFLIKTNTQSIRAHSVIFATGARANKLNLPNEQLFWNKGISACAICDGATPQFRNEQLVVIGGGDSACEEAVYLTKFGSRVHLIVRSKNLKASGSMRDRVLANPLIKIHWETEVIDVLGDEWLSDIKVRNKTTNENKLIKAKGLFYAIGHTPNTELIQNQVNTTSHGYIKVLEGRPETSVEGFFAAGDVSDSEWRQGVTAAGSGCKAALSAERWLSKNNLSILRERTDIEPSESRNELEIKTTDLDSFDQNALWQKGRYALKRIYKESNKPLIVLYTSRNCGPCHVLKPQLKRILRDLNGELQLVEIDIEKDVEIANQANITGTPTVQLFKEKALISEWKGVKQRSEYINEIKKII